MHLCHGCHRRVSVASVLREAIEHGEHEVALTTSLAVASLASWLCGVPMLIHHARPTRTRRPSQLVDALEKNVYGGDATMRPNAALMAKYLNRCAAGPPGRDEPVR